MENPDFPYVAKNLFISKLKLLNRGETPFPHSHERAEWPGVSQKTCEAPPQTVMRGRHLTNPPLSSPASAARLRAARGKGTQVLKTRSISKMRKALSLILRQDSITATWVPFPSRDPYTDHVRPGMTALSWRKSCLTSPLPWRWNRARPATSLSCRSGSSRRD